LTALALTLAAGVADARAQQVTPLALDPPLSRQGTAALVSVDALVLTSGSEVARSLTYVLPRGMRFDDAARVQACTRDEAAGDACPEAAGIGFGRYVVTVRDFASWGGEAELAWSITASLGRPVRRGDAASVVLTAKLLGTDSVAALLAPALGASAVPQTVTTVGRVVRRPSGIELRFAGMPVRFGVEAPASVTPSRLELSLSAVRRVRRTFVRRVRVRTLAGYEVRRIPDHRLVGHHLLRTPPSCGGEWRSELRVGFPSGVRRTASPIACADE
jgi:hypothetical protein